MKVVLNLLLTSQAPIFNAGMQTLSLQISSGVLCQFDLVQINMP